MDFKELSNLSSVLKENGDEILDASSRLCISAGLLKKMNESFKTIFNLSYPGDSSTNCSFHVLPQGESNRIIDQFLDLQLLYDFVQKTIGLKLFSDTSPRSDSNSDIDISIFRNLKLLEVRKLSLNLLRGLKNLRAQLEYLICIKTANNLKEVLENCGGDRVQGYVWNELKQVVFSHNGIDDLGASLEFVPQLNSIDLSHNQIQNADYINCLSNLKYLNLSFNCLTSVPSFSGQLCTVLLSLILRNNYIEDIKELSVLVNLKDLDLSNNCLIDHTHLYPITNLINLTKLDLKGNPLSYHPLHRNKTAMYLHVKSPKNFILENACLTKSELRMLGALFLVQQNPEMSSSTNSVNTVNTVVPANSTATVRQDETTSDVDLDSNSGDQTIVSSVNWGSTNGVVGQECGEGMQDSGFDAGQRPDSPSESIDRPRSSHARLLVVADVHAGTVTEPSSAASLQSSNEDTVRYCESDIEILSNPSQSSIEVISNRSCPRFVQQSSSAILTHHTVSDPCANVDLKKPASEMHKSL